MEIKELHLRNIASIEDADIDFEKGLTDGVTGDPASVFLISGDTGAGKSVLLDGLAMALYKNTPRIAGVANSQKNEFTDAEGENIRVGSIEQYTRIGISEKNECYSEVVFIGNDGVEYRAKLTLGMMLGNTDKSTGKRPLKHRNPKWEVRVGGGDWTSDSVAKTIENAVGLTFEQFGRMAMLAQGQFAAFLTGDKKEREAILEQLTNTESFTKYGTAIKRLRDKAKEERDVKQTEYDTESLHTLPEDTVKSLNEEKKGLESEVKDLEGRIKKNDELLVLVNAVEEGRKKADKEKDAKTALENQVSSEEYKADKALVEGWESTVTERQRLYDLSVARDKFENAKQSEAKNKSKFAALCADLLKRQEDIKAMGDPAKAIEEKQAEIDSLTSSREQLKPTEINEKLTALSDKKGKLNTLSSRIESYEKSEAELAALTKELEDYEKTIKDSEDDLSKVKNEYDVSKARLEEARQCFYRMNVSMEETLKDLRKNLSDEHAEICPLCGQNVESFPRDEFFAGMLEPLKDEKIQAEVQFTEAEKHLKEVQTKYDSLCGARDGKLKEKRKKEESVQDEWSIITKKAREMGMSGDAPLKDQIKHLSGQYSEDESRLKGLQAKAEDLQKKINAAQKEKKPLDEKLQKYLAESQLLEHLEGMRRKILEEHADWATEVDANVFLCKDIFSEWNDLVKDVSSNASVMKVSSETINSCKEVLSAYYEKSGKTEADLLAIDRRKKDVQPARDRVKEVNENLKSRTDALADAEKRIQEALEKLGVTEEKDIPVKEDLLKEKKELGENKDELTGKIGAIDNALAQNNANVSRLDAVKVELDKANEKFGKWDLLNGYFGGTRFRTLVQTYILRPLLKNANIYLEKITDQYRLTCSEDNEQLSILVHDRYNKDQIRSVTVLSGGERFMISLALSLALSSLNRPDMNVNILFIDEGFGTLDAKSLDSVMQTLEKLQEIAGQSKRRVGIISHREELDERIPVQIRVKKKGEGRSRVEIKNS